jgi:hypothetical protein
LKQQTVSLSRFRSLSLDNSYSYTFTMHSIKQQGQQQQGQQQQGQQQQGQHD